MTHHVRELVQLYDDQGNPSDTSTIQEAIDKNLRRGVARIFVMDIQGRVCIQKRSETMEIAPGLYDQSAGGHIDAGEDPKTAALRELGEELDIHPDRLVFIGDYPFEEPAEHGTRYSYDFLFFTRVRDNAFHMQREEVSEVRWLSVDDLVKEYQERPGRFAPSMKGSLPRLVEYTKSMNTPITVEATINAPLENVWTSWTEPEHLTKWCAASDDWHAPSATNDLRVGGRFLTRMEAKDGSAGFDFEGTCTDVAEGQRIEYVMDDGRKVLVTFSPEGEGTRVTEVFDPETENPREMQEAGWQSILNNFKTYTESI